MFLARKTKMEVICKASPRFLGCSVKILSLKFPSNNIFKFSDGVSASVYIEMEIRYSMTKAQIYKILR